MTDFSLLFILINTWLIIRMCKSNKVHLLLKILLCVSYFGWNAVPALLMYLPDLLGMGDLTTNNYILCSYYNQIFLFFSYSFAFWLIKKKKSPVFISRKDYQDTNNFFSFFVSVSVILAIYKCYTLIISQGSYWDGNNIDNITALGPIDFASNMAITFLTGAILLCKESFKPSIYKLSLALIAIFLLIHTLRGGRIYIFGLVIILLYYGLSEHKTRLIIGTGIVGILGLSLLPILGSLRGESKIQLEDISAASSTPTGQLVIEEVLTKTNSVLYGSYLLGQDGIGKWDGKMYSSTIYALIPRFIYPSKPEPGSVDGTQYGLPGRASFSYNSIGEYNNMGSNGVPASISSLWGGGWIAYVFEILSSGLLLFLINCVFYSKKALLLSFVMSLIAFPATIMEVPLPTILIQVQRYVVIYFVIGVFFLRKKQKMDYYNL